MEGDRSFREPAQRRPAPAETASSRPSVQAQLERLRERVRGRHYSPHTEGAYVSWVNRYALFHRGRDPGSMAEREVGDFLSHLATQEHVAASTQNQGPQRAALLLRRGRGPPPRLGAVVRARRPRRLPQVLSREEVGRLLAQLHGVHWLMASLTYGSGFRLMERARLRVMDIDFGLGQVVVRDGKVGAARLRAWQWVFPARGLRFDRRWDRWRRPHQHPSTIQRVLREAVRLAGIDKPVSCHTLRHCFATHLLENGHDLRTIQEPLGHKDVTTTLIYTHFRSGKLRTIRSPADGLQ